MCQTRKWPALFDNLVGCHKQCLWHSEAELLCGFKVQHQLKPRRTFNRNIRRLCSTENLIHVRGSTSGKFENINTIRDKPSSLGKEPKRIDRRKMQLRGQINDKLHCTHRCNAGYYYKSSPRRLAEVFDSRLKIVRFLGRERNSSQSLLGSRVFDSGIHT